MKNSCFLKLLKVLSRPAEVLHILRSLKRELKNGLIGTFEPSSTHPH